MGYQMSTPLGRSLSHVVISQDKIITDKLVLTRFLTHLNKPWYQGVLKAKRRESIYLPIPITSFPDRFDDF